MLWQIERILLECPKKPTILIMENVPQVLTSPGWREWYKSLEDMGYSNYCTILNSKNYGIAQSRDRAFMISILGDWNYHFASPVPLKMVLRDFLEEFVDDKYYLTPDQLKAVLGWNAQQNPFDSLGRDASPTITTRSGAHAAGMILTSDMDFEEEKVVGEELSKMYKDKTTLSKWTDLEAKMITPEGNVRRYIDSEVIDDFNEGQCADISFPKGYNKGSRVHDECPTINCTTSKSFVVKPCELRRDEGIRFFKDDMMGTLRTTSQCGDKHILDFERLNIRKLTSKEAYRLMAFNDSDYDHALEVINDNLIFHTAGDSIVTTCISAILCPMLDVDFNDFIKNWTYKK